MTLLFNLIDHAPTVSDAEAEQALLEFKNLLVQYENADAQQKAGKFISVAVRRDASLSAPRGAWEAVNSNSTPQCDNAINWNSWVTIPGTFDTLKVDKHGLPYPSSPDGAGIHSQWPTLDTSRSLSCGDSWRRYYKTSGCSNTATVPPSATVYTAPTISVFATMQRAYGESPVEVREWPVTMASPAAKLGRYTLGIDPLIWLSLDPIDKRWLAYKTAMFLTGVGSNASPEASIRSINLPSKTLTAYDVAELRATYDAKKALQISNMCPIGGYTGTDAQLAAASSPMPN